MGLTETVARFIAESRLKSIPAEAIEKAKKAVADTLGVIRRCTCAVPAAADTWSWKHARRTAAVTSCV